MSITIRIVNAIAGFIIVNIAGTLISLATILVMMISPAVGIAVSAIVTLIMLVYLVVGTVVGWKMDRRLWDRGFFPEFFKRLVPAFIVRLFKPDAWKSFTPAHAVIAIVVIAIVAVVLQSFVIPEINKARNEAEMKKEMMNIHLPRHMRR